MNQPGVIEKYAPGTKLTVGSHRVKVLKYLTSGGYAHVYSVEITYPDSPSSNRVACLKRVVIPDKTHLNSLRAEVETMRILKGNRFVVSYIDSHATKSPKNDGTYEVYLLMEYCSRGGLIDFMNTRLQNRLQEHEVLIIMSQSCQGIAAMHALEPPLIHRDIKIENILIAENGDFKVCDFGSVSGIIRVPRNAEEFGYVQHDIMKNTTAQYRSPEMLDLYRGLPIDEKSDIWALGVFLFKLCYYTTPFERNGESAIIQGKFQFPAFPQYSDRIKNLISVMLRPDPLKRPNICQVLEEISRIQGVPCPIKNFYLLRAMSRQNTQLLTKPRVSPTPPLMQPLSQNNLQQVVTSVQPRARSELELNKRPQSVYSTATTSSSVLNSNIDPFTQLDRSSLLKSNPVDTLGSAKIVIPELSYNQAQLNRSQTVSPSRSINEAKGDRGNISSIVSFNRTSFDRSRYVNSETQTSDLLQAPVATLSEVKRSSSSVSVSSVESLNSISTGGSFTRRIGSKLKRIVTGEKPNGSPIKSRQNTGDSVRSAFSVLRMGRSGSQHLDDGVSLKYNQDRKAGHRRSSSGVSFEEQPSERSYSHRRSTSSLSFVPENNQYEIDDLYGNGRSISPMRRTSSLKTSSSIQKRVKDLLNAKDVPSISSTSNYVKYNDNSGKKISNGHCSTSPDELQSGARQSSTVITPFVKNKKPVPPPKPAHLRPTIPPKPKHLRSVNHTEQHQMTTNTNDDILLNEKSSESDFKRRFPSAL